MATVFINPERCIGCLQCELACALEHSRSKQLASSFRETPVPRKRIHVEPGPVPTLAFPNRCRHCNPAPCQAVCPTGAITFDEEHRLVLLDEAKCIGCAMCAVVCPFDTITFHPSAKGVDVELPVAVKCDGCVERVSRGDPPACVEVCKVDALVFGELNDLVAAGRTRLANAVFSSAGQRPAPDPLAAWHKWGEDSAAVDATAGHRSNGKTSSTPRSEGRPE